MDEAKVSLGRALRVLREVGWTPGGIIDIGVAAGTTGLYSAWPGVPICLIEPSPDALVFMRQIAERYANVHIFNCGASNRTGEAEARKADGLVNVFFGRRYKGSEPVTVPMRTCDDMVAEAGLEPPFLYKLDTDSHEREVLEGSARTLAQAEVCIVECNIFHQMRGCMTPAELWAAMTRHGFLFADICDAGYGAIGVMRSTDLVFVRENVLQRLFENASKSADRDERRARQYRDAVADNPHM